jgi:hypothetical protein
MKICTKVWQIDTPQGEGIALPFCIPIAVYRADALLPVGRHDSCRRAPQGANPVLIYENLPIGSNFYSAAWVMPPYSKVFDSPINSNLILNIF